MLVGCYYTLSAGDSHRTRNVRDVSDNSKYPDNELDLPLRLLTLLRATLFSLVIALGASEDDEDSPLYRLLEGGQHSFEAVDDGDRQLPRHALLLVVDQNLSNAIYIQKKFWGEGLPKWGGIIVSQASDGLPVLSTSIYQDPG